MGITVLISSHILDELSRIATWYGFIDSGHIVREMSAGELEQACKKKTVVTVSDTAAFARVLDMQRLDYRIVNESTAELYQSIAVTTLFDAAKEAGCTILSMHEQDESLESFYLNLVGCEVAEMNRLLKVLGKRLVRDKIFLLAVAVTLILSLYISLDNAPPMAEWAKAGEEECGILITRQWV